jgi:peroxiredoxin Q/BCP
MINKFEDMDSDGDTVLTVGDKAPDFALTTEKGGEWRLSDHSGQVVVLLFYPQNETLVCTRQLCSLRDHWADYMDTNASIVGVSPGTIEEHRKFAESHHLPLPLLADPGRRITELFGKHWILPIFMTRAVVVIDAGGVIRVRRVMIRAFKPSDRSVLTAIYRATGDAMLDEYGKLVKEKRALLAEKKEFFDQNQ